MSYSAKYISEFWEDLFMANSSRLMLCKEHPILASSNLGELSSGRGYANVGLGGGRITKTYTAPTEELPVGEVVFKNARSINFGTATAVWERITHFAIKDEHGNIVWYTEAPDPIPLVTVGDSFRFRVDGFQIIYRDS